MLFASLPILLFGLATPGPQAPDAPAAPAPTVEVPAAPEPVHVEDTLRVLVAELALDTFQADEVRGILRRERTSRLIEDLRERMRAEEEAQGLVEVGLDASELSLLGPRKDVVDPFQSPLEGAGPDEVVDTPGAPGRPRFAGASRGRRGRSRSDVLDPSSLSLLGPGGARRTEPDAFPIDPIPTHEVLRPLRATTLDDILKTLDPQQRERYEAMLGPGGEEALRQLARQRAQAWQRTGFATAPSGPLAARGSKGRGPRAAPKEKRSNNRGQSRRRNQRQPRKPRPKKTNTGGSGGGTTGGTPPPLPGPKPRGAVPRPGGGGGRGEPRKTDKSRGPG